MPCMSVTCPATCTCSKPINVIKLSFHFFFAGCRVLIPVPSKIRNTSWPGKRQFEGKKVSLISKSGRKMTFCSQGTSFHVNKKTVSSRHRPTVVLSQRLLLCAQPLPSRYPAELPSDNPQGLRVPCLSKSGTSPQAQTMS